MAEHTTICYNLVWPIKVEHDDKNFGHDDKNVFAACIQCKTAYNQKNSVTHGGGSIILWVQFK